MPLRRPGISAFVLTLIGAFTFIFAAMAIKLWLELSVIYPASKSDRWSIQQLDTEFAKFSQAIAEHISSSAADDFNIRLRTEILLSRIKLINEGDIKDLLYEDPRTMQLNAQLLAFFDAASKILDSTPVIGQAEILALKKLDNDTAEVARRLVIISLALDSAAEDEKRGQFVRNFTITQVLTLSVLIFLTALMIGYRRLLGNLSKQDAELQATYAQSASTVGASLDGIVISDQLCRIVEFNAAAQAIFGWSRSEVLGQKFEDALIPDRNRAWYLSELKRFLNNGQSEIIDAGRLEIAALRKTGEEFPTEINITTTVRGDDTLFITYIRDISAQKINEQALIDARLRAERSDRAKSRFVAVMSHEMRTPLNGILGVLDLLKTTRMTDDQQHYVSVASASGEILLKQVNEALDITRIESGAITVLNERFNLRDAVQHVVEILTPLAAEKILTLDFTFDEAFDLDYFGDGVRIGQIVTNLLGNGIKFTDDGGVKVSVFGIHGPSRSMITIEVEDTGPGINGIHSEEIFEDFVAFGQSEGRQTRSDGLGLSISRRIAREMGGDLTLASTTATGSTFHLTVPLLRAKGGPVRAAPAPNPAIDAVPEGAAKTILIIEDNPVNRAILREMLTKLGHNVREAKDGGEGLAAVQTSTFDLIIMDISMPIIDGIELTKLIRANDNPNRETYILGLTAHSHQDFREPSLQAGMDAFATKPIRFSTLQTAIEDTNYDDLDCDVEDAITEMIAALGIEQTRHTADRFFAELDSSVRTLKTLSPVENSDKIAENLHRLRGGAATLGLHRLISEIDCAAQANDSRDCPGFLSALEIAEDSGKTAMSDLQEIFAELAR